MAITSATALVDTMRHLRLLSARQLDDANSYAKGPTDARTLARFVVQQGWLTVYQANQLLLGKGKSLVFGSYHILDVLGKGGLSEVYKARHLEHGWIVALKVLKPEALEDESGKAQFLREMEAMTYLDHINIVQFCDVDQAEGTYYYAMEYVDGTDLGKYVNLTGRLPVIEACEYILQTALGLQHAHERNLVHRDIKPVNLFLTHMRCEPARPGGKPTFQPIVKILDWGLATPRMPKGMDEPRATGQAGLIGTADYLSPEQAKQPDAADIRSDIYSLGCTFYYLLTGQPPFPEGNLMKKLLLHQTQPPPPITEQRPDVYDDVNLIIQRMLAKDPADRFQTPAALALALQPHTQPDAENIPITREILDLGRRIIRPSINEDTPLPRSLGDKPRDPAANSEP